MFVNHINETCENDVAMICLELIDFSEKTSDELSWGTGEDFGTMTYRCNSDYGLLPLFRLSSNGKINLQLNFLRSKNLHKQVLQDMIIKFESNFLRDYDQESYPSDSYEPLEDLICTNKQLHSFMKAIEGCTYRLKQ
ncbi:MAG: hypothetical protein VX271_03375 [Candidatus Neomarinimicrobiota bacterium]|nr:hypothetical protein [Candidatus Neomarinimicrobiota bacterium]|tara:strand:+ start:2973 stop:3383 length:411 start_codon:yes stop_codon:yes gene_type:complete